MGHWGDVFGRRGKTFGRWRKLDRRLGNDARRLGNIAIPSGTLSNQLERLADDCGRLADVRRYCHTFGKRVRRPGKIDIIWNLFEGKSEPTLKVARTICEKLGNDA